MVYPRQCFHLLAKLLLHPPIRISFKHLLKQDFNDDWFAHQLLIAREIDHSDTAASKLALNQVTPVEQRSFITSKLTSARLISLQGRRPIPRDRTLLLFVSMHANTFEAGWLDSYKFN